MHHFRLTSLLFIFLFCRCSSASKNINCCQNLHKLVLQSRCIVNRQSAIIQYLAGQDSSNRSIYPNSVNSLFFCFFFLFSLYSRWNWKSIESRTKSFPFRTLNVMRCWFIRLNDHFIAFNSILIHNKRIKIILFFSPFMSFVHFISVLSLFIFPIECTQSSMIRNYVILLLLLLLNSMFNAQCASFLGEKKIISFFIMWIKIWIALSNDENTNTTHVTRYTLPSFIVFVSDYIFRFCSFHSRKNKMERIKFLIWLLRVPVALPV